MTIKEAKTIDFVTCLSAQGFEPAKAKDNELLYYCSFRQETKPSFKVNCRRNRSRI